MVAIIMLDSSVVIPMPWATIDGISGVKPKMSKLKKVTMLFVKGFSSPAMSWSYSIIIIFKNPSLFLLNISTISADTLGYNPI